MNIKDILNKMKDIIKKMLNLKDCPNRLAKSFSLGFGLALLPLPGINIFLSAVLAKLFRLNILAATMPGILLAYVSPFLYILNYKTGALFITTGNKMPPPKQIEVGIDYNLTFFSKMIDFITHMGTAYLLGSIINGILAATLAYVIFWLMYKSTNKLMDRNKGNKDNNENENDVEPVGQ